MITQLVKSIRLCLFQKTLQINCKRLQQINFIGKIKKNTGATMFFIIEKSENTTFEFSQNSVNIL